MNDNQFSAMLAIIVPPIIEHTCALRRNKAELPRQTLRRGIDYGHIPAGDIFYWRKRGHAAYHRQRKRHDNCRNTHIRADIQRGVP